MPNLFAAKAYLYYRTHAVGKHGIHSPFVFHLVTKVFPQGPDEPEEHPAEDWRTECLLNHHYLNVLDLGTGNSGPRKISDIAKRAAKSPAEGRLLHRIVKHFKPKQMLELGTSLGISSIYLATATNHEQFISLEGCPETAAFARKHFVGNDYRIELRTGDFSDTLSVALHDLGKVDLVFFDGNHTREATLFYFESCLPFIHNNSVFIFDDIHWSEGMEQAWKEIKKHPKVRLTIDLFHFGLVFFREEQLECEHFTVRF